MVVDQDGDQSGRAMRGLVELSAPVTRYWPVFAANGKQDIEIRHILSHTSGVSGWEPPFRTGDMYDWEESTAALAAQAPWWPPGTASGYHAHNHGHLIGEVLRRVTGKTLKEFVRDEIAGPLGADFQIGARPADFGRIAEVIPPPPLELPLDQLPGVLGSERTTKYTTLSYEILGRSASAASGMLAMWARCFISPRISGG